jgi:hypothetical protein
LGFLFKKESRKQAFPKLRLRDTSRYSFCPLSAPLFIEAVETINFYLRTFYTGMSMNGMDLRLYSETNHKLLIVIGEITEWGAIGKW